MKVSLRETMEQDRIQGFINPAYSSKQAMEEEVTYDTVSPPPARSDDSKPEHCNTKPCMMILTCFTFLLVLCSLSVSIYLLSVREERAQEANRKSVEGTDGDLSTTANIGDMQIVISILVEDINASQSRLEQLSENLSITSSHIGDMQNVISATVRDVNARLERLSEDLSSNSSDMQNVIRDINASQSRLEQLSEGLGSTQTLVWRLTHDINSTHFLMRSLEETSQSQLRAAVNSVLETVTSSLAEINQTRGIIIQCSDTCSYGYLYIQRPPLNQRPLGPVPIVAIS
jgi:archaellum component FlaC